MTCQSSGRSPTIAMGLGALVTPSRMRMPRPPQNSTTFIWAPSDNLKRGNRDHQPATPVPDVVQLLGDLGPEIPRQHQDVVRFGLGEALWRVDRDVRPWQEFALLDRAPVDGVGEQVGPDAAVVEQRVALARGAVTRHRLAPLSRVDKELQQVGLYFQHLAREAVVALSGVQ